MELSIVIEKMMILVLIMLVGFIARKAKLTDDEANRYFSRLLINVFLVCSILRSTVNVDPVLSGREMLLLFGLFALGFGIYWLSHEEGPGDHHPSDGIHQHGISWLSHHRRALRE